MKTINLIVNRRTVLLTVNLAIFLSNLAVRSATLYVWRDSPGLPHRNGANPA